MKLRRKKSALLISKMAAVLICIFLILSFFSYYFYMIENRKICKYGKDKMVCYPSDKSKLTKQPQQSKKMESAYLIYVNCHDYMLVLKCRQKLYFPNQSITVYDLSVNYFVNELIQNGVFFPFFFAYLHVIITQQTETNKKTQCTKTISKHLSEQIYKYAFGIFTY